MKRIDLKDISRLSKSSFSLNAGDFLLVTEDREERYVLMPIADFELLQSAYEEVCESDPFRFGIPTEIRLVNRGGKKLSVEEYEKIKQQLMTALETLKPDEKN